MADTRVGWDGLANPREQAPTYSQMAEQQRQVQVEQDKQSLWSLATEDMWTLNGGSRAFERSFMAFQDDPTFKVDEEESKVLAQELGFQQANDLIKESKSRGELEAKLNWTRADIKRAQDISQYGWQGTGAQLLAAVMDPVGWGVGMISAPIMGASKVASMGRLGRAAAGAALGATENSMLESVMYAGDTQRHADDVFIAAGFGGLLGGTIGALSRQRPHLDVEGRPVTQADEGLDSVIRGADEFDREASRAVREAMEYDAYMAIRSQDIDPTRVDVDMDIAIHMEGLRREANVRMSAKDKGNVKVKVRDTEARIRQLEAEHVSAKAELAAQTGVVRGTEAFDFDVAKRLITRRYEEPLADLNRQLEELKGQVSRVEGVGAAKAEYKRFSSLSREEQMAELGLGAPARQVEVRSAVRDALKAIRQERRETPTEAFARQEAEAKVATPADDSLSAARVQGSEIKEEQFDLSDRMEDLMDDLAREAYNSPIAARKILGNASSAFAVLSNSKNPIFRGLAIRWLENAQGGSYHGKTAAILSDVNNNIIRSAEKNRYNDGFSTYLKEIGAHPMDYLKPGVSRQFDKEVYSAIVNGIPEGTSPGIKLAAEGVRDKFARALALRKAAGEAGFESVESAADYIPKIIDGIKITEATNRVGKQGVIDLLSIGYQTGKYKMGKKSADAVARAQYLRASDATLSSRVSFDRVVSQEQQAMLVADLKKSGVPDDIIDHFIEGNELREMADAVSSRAKQSLGINTEASLNGIKVQDLMNTNVGELAENYGKEAAGGAALARMGFKSKQEAFNAIDAAERAGRNMEGADIKQLRMEADMLRDAVRLISGNTIDADPNSGIVRASRRMREVTGLLRLGQMGFAQAPEIARSIVKMGLGTVLSSVPSTKFLRSRAGRAGKSAQGELLEPELREIEELMGYIGEDNWMTGWNVRHDEFGETAGNMNKLSQVMDSFLSAGGRINTVLSGFKAIQGGGEKIVNRSIAKRLKEHLSGGKQLPKADLEEIGFDDAFMAKLQRHFDDNPKTDMYNGKEVRMLNFEDMEPDMREMVGVGMRRMAGRLIQRNFVGDEGVWMNKWWGKALTQFKSFSIVSLEKQLVHDLRGDKAQAAMILGWSSLLGYAAYSTQMQMQAIGRADRDEFLEQKFSTENLSMGVFNKLPQVASFGLAGDFLATMGLMPDSLTQAPGRMGFQTMGFGELVPAGGVVGDVADFSRAMVNYATGNDDVSTRQVVDKLRRLVPLANTIGVGQMTKAAADLTEE